MSAVNRQSVPRMKGVTADYTEVNGLRSLHENEGRSLPLLTIPALNDGASC
ncbi:MAG: hypothetical protein RL042_1820 [Nitrospirota bacterium]|jgi:hypothetical protein